MHFRILRLLFSPEPRATKHADGVEQLWANMKIWQDVNNEKKAVEKCRIYDKIY